MTVPDSGKTWRKSSYSSQGGDCVEVAGSLDTIRDSKNPGPELAMTRSAFVRLRRALG